MLKQDGVQFVAKLKENNYKCQHVIIPRENHFTILLSFGMMQSQLESTEKICLRFIKSTVSNNETDLLQVEN